MLIFLFIIFFLFFGLKILSIFIVKPGNTFDIYFGVPGCGKTTIAAWLTKKANKKNRQVLSNVPIKGACKVQKEDIGVYYIHDCDLIMDEAGIDYDNRNFKSFTSSEKYFYKYHRHYKVNVSMFSQDVDVDLKLRKLTTRYYVVTKSFLPFFVKRKLAIKRIGIDKLTHQIIDEFYFPLFGSRYIFMPSLWKMFDSYSYKDLPPKEWQPY